MPVVLIAAGAAATVNTAASAYSARKNRKAVQKAADAQTLAQNEAIARQEEQTRLAAEAKQPYADFGKASLQPLQDITTARGQAEYLSEGNPLFKAALSNLNTITLNNAAVRGRVGAGDTKQNFLQNWQAAAMPILQNQQNVLFRAAGIGENASSDLSNIYMNNGNTVARQQEALGNIESNQIMGEQAAKNKFYADAISEHSKFANTFQSMYGGGGGSGGGGVTSIVGGAK